MTPEQPKTISVDEAAAALGVGRATYYNALERGEVPGIRVGRRILVPRLQLEKMLRGEAWRVEVAK